MSDSRKRDDLTTMQLPRRTREAIKRKKRGDESYADFLTRRLRL
jgi:hypothetical protein